MTIKPVPCPKCGSRIPFEWTEEPGYQSRVLEWVRECTRCGYSPDRYTPV